MKPKIFKKIYIGIANGLAIKTKRKPKIKQNK